MSQVTITLPDGSTRTVPAGTPVRDVAAEISPGLAKAALAGIVEGKLVDLSYPIDKDAALRIVTDRSPEALPLFRHSTAHLLAAAVTSLFPGAQCGIGPATDEGFFYDFVVERPFVPEDLERIEKKMKELAAEDLPYERQMWPRDEAKAFFAKRGEPLKVQLIDEKTAGQKEVSCYTIKDPETFIDFCVGPHVPSTGKLKAFKVLTASNAYWKGDARNQPMQRVYGTAFLSEKDLKAHLTQVEEAKKRDHRKLGRDLGLFMFHPWAPGAAFWLDKGTTLYHTLANYMRDVLFPAGYVEVKTPLIFNKALWETSGHWSHYRQNMFLIDPGLNGPAGDNAVVEEMGVKAMNCPGHMLVFGARGDEATGISRFACTSRRRSTGTRRRACCRALRASGSFRRTMRTASSRRSRLATRCERLLGLVQRVYADFGLSYTAKLATRPPEFLGDDSDVGFRGSAAQGGARRGRDRRTSSMRVTARSTARRSTSTSPTRSAGSGSAPRSSSTTRSRSGST